MRNKRGVASVAGLALMYLVTVAGTVSMGAMRLFSGGPDGVSSGVITAAKVLAIYSQMPHVKDNFQRTRAVEICEYEGMSSCDALVKTLDSDQILAYIRDDGRTTFYDPKPAVKSGGGLRARILAAQR